MTEQDAEILEAELKVTVGTTLVVTTSPTGVTAAGLQALVHNWEGMGVQFCWAVRGAPLITSANRSFTDQYAGMIDGYQRVAAA